MIFSPAKFPGLPIGLGALALIGLFDLYLLNLAAGTSPSALTLGLLLVLLASLPLLTWIGYCCQALLTARYVVGRNALVIEWGGRRELIPLDQLGEVRLGSALGERLHPEGLVWPGYHLGWATSPTRGPIEFIATSLRPEALVYVQYAGGWLALSPNDPEIFLTTLTARQTEGMDAPLAPESVRADFAQWPVWRDRLALGLIGISGVSVIALTTYLILIYPQLPGQIALHFNPQGLPDRFGPPTGLFLLPTIAGVAWAINTLGGVWLHRLSPERNGAYLILGATVFVQILVWVATLGLLTAGPT